MSLRAQLVLAFLLLAVVPQVGVTVYSYLGSERALRAAVAVEGRAAAAEMGMRMERTTADIERRLERVRRLPFTPVRAEDPAAREAQREQLLEHFRDGLGEAAGFVESFLVLEEPPPPASPELPGRHAPPAPPPAPHPFDGEMIVIEPREGASGEDRLATRLVLRQLAEGEPLTPEQQQALAGSIERGAAAFGRRLERKVRALEKRVAEHPEAVRAIAELRQNAAQVARKASEAIVRHGDEFRVLMGRPLDFTLEHEGESLGTMQARVRGQRLIHETLAATRGADGEVHFAVDPEGRVYAGDDESKQRAENLGVAELAAGGEPSRVVRRPGNWMIVTRRDDESGLTLGIARPLGEPLRRIRETALWNLACGLGIAGLAFAGIVPLSRRMTRDLERLAAGAEELSRGNLDARVPVRSRDEVGRLAASFNEMAASLRVQRGALVERERLRKELEMSRRIQEELLPRGPLRLAFAEVSGVSIPAREVGGDFFNYFTLPGGELAVLVGDVSGKGVPAALLAANLQAMLRARLPLESDLAALAVGLDEQVDASTPGYAYVTLFMAIFDPGSRRLRWLNAGHNPQYLARAAGGCEPLGPGGRPLGLLPGGGFEPGERVLEDGDALLLYTDGLIDAENAAGDYFGNERLEALLAGSSDRSPGAMLARVEAAVREFRGDVEAGDDATLVVLQLGPAAGC